MRFSAYPKYKPCGVEWLREIPQHWESLPLRRRFRVVNGGTPSSAEEGFWDGDITWLTPDDLGKIDKKRIVNGRRQISKEGLDNCGATLVPRSSLIVSTRAPIGYVAINDVVASTNQGCRSLVSEDKNVSTDFFYYALVASRDVLQAVGKGTTFMELSAGALASHFVPIPSPTEQRAIAEFLDAETSRIDTLVAKKRELIEKLKEKRSALISCIVTLGLPPEAARAAGLNPNPKLKPSGIEWLGEIPEHCEVKQLKWAIMFQRGHDLPTDDREEGSVPLVTSSGVSATHSTAAAKGPGIVTGRYGTIGEFYLVQEDYWPLNTTLYSIDLRGNEPRFLCYMLTHLGPLFLLNAVKSAVPGIDRNDIHSIKAVVPSHAEQRAIADYLDRETNKIDRMVAKVEEAIERLQEYRTALITAAVTGKIDVRKRAA